jgi:Enoyl-(Acyl carrier protein) reductase
MRKLDLYFGDALAVTEMSAVHPIGRIGRPEEIADAVAWLFSDRSSYYTGQSLTLDGGLTAQRPYVTQPASDKLVQNAPDKKRRVDPVAPSMANDLNYR